MKKLLMDRNALYAGLGILLLGFFLRIYNLTILPVFADEAIYVRWAQVMRAENTLRFLPLSDGKQPLFMWIVIPFLKIFSDPVFAGRFVSVLTGMGSLAGVFTLSYLLFKSRKVALASSLIYSVVPYAVFFDRMALVDSMLAMFGIWAVILSILTVRYTRLDTAMLAGFALGGAALTKSPALFFALLLPSVLIFVNFAQDLNKKVIHLAKVLGLMGVTGVIAFAIYNILRLGPNFHLVGSRNLDYVHPYNHILENPLDPFIPHITRAFEWLRIFGPELLIVFIVLGIFRNFIKNKRQILFLLLWAFLPIAIQAMYAKVFTARYIFFTIPFWIILAGSSFTGKFIEVGRKLAYGLLGIFVLHALFINWAYLTNPENSRLPRSERSGYLEEWTAGTGIKEVSEYIRLELAREPEVPIVVGTEGYFGTLPDALQAYLEKVPNVTVIGIGLGINQVPPQLAEAVKSGSKAYMVANSSRLNFDKDFEEYGLEVVAKYKKADRPSGIREFEQHGQFDYLYFFKVISQ